jgi:hypothetical protein
MGKDDNFEWDNFENFTVISRDLFRKEGYFETVISKLISKMVVYIMYIGNFVITSYAVKTLLLYCSWRPGFGGRVSAAAIFSSCFIYSSSIFA